MAKLDEKIMRIEAYVRELAQDRDDFAKDKIAQQLDAKVAKTWVLQLDQVTTLLTAMLDDWKEVTTLRPVDDKRDADVARNVGNTKGLGNGRAKPSDEFGSTDDQ